MAFLFNNQLTCEGYKLLLSLVNETNCAETEICIVYTSSIVTTERREVFVKQFWCRTEWRSLERWTRSNKIGLFYDLKYRVFDFNYKKEFPIAFKNHICRPYRVINLSSSKVACWVHYSCGLWAWLEIRHSSVYDSESSETSNGVF